MKFLPPTNNKVLLWIVMFGCFFLSLLLYKSVLVYIKGHAGIIPIPSFLTLILLVGLWRVTEWARKTITILVVMSAIIVPIGIINPYNAMEMQNPPSVWYIAVITYLPIAGSLIYVFLLGQYRDHFRRVLV